MKKEPKSTTSTSNSNPNQNSNPNPKPNTDLLSEISSEVSQENAPLLEFINAHGSKIALAVGVVLIIASIIGVFKWYNHREAQKILESKVKIEMTLQGEAKLKALQELMQEAPSQLKTLLALTLGEQASDLKNYEIAAFAYAEAAKSDADGHMGPLAEMAQASCLLHQDKNKEALELLQSLINRFPSPQPLHLRQMLTNAAIRAGQTELATQTLQAMVNDVDGEDQEYLEYLLKQIKSSNKSEHKPQTTN